jgi:DNA-binding NarL/FixJ family response regulator
MTDRLVPGARLLLVEPHFVLRRTTATLARDMGLADVQEATSTATAERLLHERRFDAMLIALDDEGAALELVRRLRAGESVQPVDLPVAATAVSCDVELALRLKQLDIRRLLLKPFKVRGMLDVIAALGGAEALPSA